MATFYQRSFLKWPGGKFRLLDRILSHVKKGLHVWYEPFVGSGSVFLNIEAEHYVLADANPHLIQLFQILQSEGRTFIQEVKQYFEPKWNVSEQYYGLRERFNHSECPHERAALFIYLNRHGFNGLCRYNQQGIFNVPFGLYAEPYFPETEMLVFHQRSQRATFLCQDFKQFFESIPSHENSMLYADPPYVPLSNSADFTQYARQGFGAQDHLDLARLTKQQASQGMRVLISNHDTELVREMYAGAAFETFPVMRSISALNKGRRDVDEVLALL